MRKILVVLLAVCVVSALVAVAFAQGQDQGQGQGRRRQPGQRGFQMGPTMNSTVAGGKIYILKENVLYKVNGADMKVEKKKKLDITDENDPTGRMAARMLGRARLTVDGKALFLLTYNAVYKIDLESLEIKGTIKADDLTPPEEEKEEEDKGKDEDNF